MTSEAEIKLILETFSLVGTKEELEQFKKDMAKIGWKLSYQGHSGHWLGEPIYKVKLKTNE